MPDKELTPQQSFEQKITDRLKKDIGDFIPDEVLKEKVEEAMQQAFFESRIIQEKTNQYGSITEARREEVPFIVAIVGDLVRDEVTRQIQLWVQEHHEEIIQIVKDIIDEGIVTHTIKTAEKQMGSIAFTMVEKFQEQLSQGVVPYNPNKY